MNSHQISDDEYIKYKNIMNFMDFLKSEYSFEYDHTTNHLVNKDAFISIIMNLKSDDYQNGYREGYRKGYDEAYDDF